MIDKKKLERRFSRHAKTYDQYAMVQKTMARNLLTMIHIARPLNILEIGCGTGYLTYQLAQSFPSSKIDALDLSPGMIEVAKTRCKALANASNIHFICADAEQNLPETAYDLIISNATFQWFNDPHATIENILNNHLVHGGQCLFSTFGTQTFWELKSAFEIASNTLNLSDPVASSQAFLSLNDWLSRLEALNLHDCKIESGGITGTEELLPEYFDSCLDFFQSIKKIGANNANASRNRSSKQFMTCVTDLYEDKFRTPEGIQATYHALYLSYSM